MWCYCRKASVLAYKHLLLRVFTTEQTHNRFQTKLRGSAVCHRCQGFGDNRAMRSWGKISTHSLSPLQLLLLPEHSPSTVPPTKQMEISHGSLRGYHNPSIWHLACTLSTDRASPLSQVKTVKHRDVCLPPSLESSDADIASVEWMNDELICYWAEMDHVDSITGCKQQQN